MPSTSVHLREATQRPENFRGDHLDMPARDLMTPGVVVIGEDASLIQALRAIRAHDVHAILVIGAEPHQPIGWITVEGLLEWIGQDPNLLRARDAVTESPTAIDPFASAREALQLLSQPGTHHLLVRAQAGGAPEGVITAVNLVALERG